MWRPVVTEPVKEMAAASLCSSRAWPTVDPRLTRLKTPGGIPAPTMMSAKVLSGCRDEIGRLQDDAIAVGECWCDFPRRNGNGKIPRRDQADDANGLARYLHVDTGPHRRDFVTDEAQAFAGEAPRRAPLQW